MSSKHFTSCLPSLVTAGLLSFGCRSTPEPSVDPAEAAKRWEADIATFAEMDEENMPRRGGIVLAGSSSFRMWKTAAEDFPERTVINRGFGGSQMSDLLFYVDELVLKYYPADVLVYEGDNDVAAGESAESIFAEFKEFVGRVHERIPRANIHFVSIKPSPKRESMMREMRKANELIEEFAEEQRRVFFINIFDPMLDDDDKPRGELFVEDQLHMNAQGYALWAQIVRKHLNLPER